MTVIRELSKNDLVLLCNSFGCFALRIQFVVLRHLGNQHALACCGSVRMTDEVFWVVELPQQDMGLGGTTDTVHTD